MLNLHVPLKTKIIRGNNKPFVSKELRKVIMFRSHLKRLYEKNDISVLEYEVFTSWFTLILNISNFKLHGIIYIRADPMVCSDRIKKRNRNGEDGISLEYTNTDILDPNIKPAINTSLEVGFDTRFLKNRLGLSFTYYKENRKDEFTDDNTGTGIYSSQSNSKQEHVQNIQEHDQKVRYKPEKGDKGEQETYDIREIGRRAWLSSRGVVASLHYDTYYNVFSQLHGMCMHEKKY